jgi:hypothetical protein
VFLLMPSELEVLQFMALIRRATIRRVAESFVPLHKKLPLMILRMRTQSQALKVCACAQRRFEIASREAAKGYGLLIGRIGPSPPNLKTDSAECAA